VVSFTADQKKAFAKAFVSKRENAWDAAQVVFSDSALAFQAAKELPTDSEVLDLISGLNNASDEDVDNGLPTRAEFIRNIWDRLQTCDDDDFTKLGKLYADVRGYINKPVDPQTPQQTNVVTHVMVVPAHSNASEWEANAKSQQRALITDGQEVLEDGKQLN